MVSLFPQLFIFGIFAPLVLRLVLGVIFLVHGYPKMFKGQVKGTGQFFDSVGIKPGLFWAWVVTVVEVVGGVFLIAGFLVQLVAALLAIQMLVAIIVKRKQGLVGGYELDLVLLGMSLALLLLGPGAFSIDLPL